MKIKLAYLSFLMASILSLVGLWLPPQGAIDGSVCIVVAQFLLFCASLAGVDALFSKYQAIINKELKK